MRDVESISPLSPAQELLLFHGIRDDGQPDLGLQQVEVLAQGTLDPARFEAAWRKVTDRHGALRTSVHWRDMSRPVQVVHRSVSVEFSYVDLRADQDRSVSADTERIRMSERQRGFDLTRAPLSRVVVIRTEEDEFRIIWFVHHIIADGWSSSIVLNDIFSEYNEPDYDHTRPPAPSYGDFVAWLLERDASLDIAFWRKELEGVTRGTKLFEATREDDASADRDGEVISIALPEAETDGLVHAARRNRVSMAAMLQGAWALTLSRALGTEDVVFGFSLAGRPTDLPGVEDTVGLFANTVPVRAHVDPASTPGAWLAAIARKHAGILRHQFVDWAGLQSVCRVPLDQLFETVLVIENYPKGFWRSGSDQSLRIVEARGGVASSFPVTVVIRYDTRIEVDMFCTGRGAALARELGQSLKFTIGRLASERDERLAQILNSIPAIDCLGGPATRTESTRNGRDEQSDAPVGFVESTLAEIWQDVLGTNIGRDEDFFDLGGSSIAAVSLFKRIEASLGSKLPLATLFEAPTIRLLARRIREMGDTTESEFLHLIRSGSDSSPLFCVHGQGGEIIYFNELARSLGDRASYGFQARGLDGSKPHRSVDEMAGAYLDELLRVRTSGPWNLLSVCGGSHIAYEMGCQLSERGEDDVTVILVDPGWLRSTVSAGSRPDDVGKAPGVVGATVRIAGGIARLPGRLYRRLIAYVNRSKGYRAMEPGQRRIAKAIRSACLTYVPRRFDGRVVIILSKTWQTRRPYLDSEMKRWQSLVSRPIEIHRLREPHTRILLAKELGSIIEPYLAANRSSDSRTPVQSRT